MKFYVLCRRVGQFGDMAPSPWGPGWAPIRVVRGTFAQYGLANDICEDFMDQHDDTYQFSVVVAEYDGPDELDV